MATAPSKRPPSKEIQKKALKHVKDYFDHYASLLEGYRQQWKELFRATYIFETDRKGDGKSQIFWPMCYRENEKVCTRLTTNNPKFVIGLNVPISPDSPEADMAANAQANQASLNYFWKIGNSQAKLRTWAKGGSTYGVMFALTDICRKYHKTKNIENYVDDNGEPQERVIEKEELLMEYPVFEVPDILDMYFDPRIEFVDDYPALIRNKDQIRKSDILSQKDIYFNLDEVKDLSAPEYAINEDAYKITKFSEQGINSTEDSPDNGVFNVKEFWGYFSETDDIKDEELYRMTVVNDSVLVRYEPINFIPAEKFVPIEVPNQGVGKGIVEPIKQLQDAYNLTRNQRFENISLIINKMWKLKQGSGIDPRKLMSVAGNTIVMREMDALEPIDFPDISQSAFAEANALNTEIQGINGTIDTTQDSSNNGFTNLATGQKIRWNEFNTRFKTIKQNLEEALGRLGQKMLMVVAERAQQNPLVLDEKTQKFYEVAKTAFDSISDFYNISVLADSTVFDSIDNKRDEALAFGQLAIAYKAQGLNIPMDKVWIDIVESFPGKNSQEFLLPPQPQPTPEQGGKPLSNTVIEQAQGQPSPEDQLNQSLTNV